MQNELNLDDEETNQYFMSTELLDTIERNHAISRCGQSVVELNQQYANLFIL